jgi:hypothetical protein
MESNIKMGLKSKGFFKKLKDGDFGLAKTFWIYTFLVGIAFQIVSKILIGIAKVAIAKGVDENLIFSILFFILILAIFSIIWLMELCK